MGQAEYDDVEIIYLSFYLISDTEKMPLEITNFSCLVSCQMFKLKLFN
jgi:hypothetical protein